jgi:flavin-dependent dehydrogenase
MDRVKALPEDEYDVIIVGAGCVGASVARELSKFAVKVNILILQLRQNRRSSQQLTALINLRAFRCYKSLQTFNF